jgi:hypothetical protein
MAIQILNNDKKNTSTASLSLQKTMHFRKAQKCGRVKHLIIGLELIVF